MRALLERHSTNLLYKNVLIYCIYRLCYNEVAAFTSSGVLQRNWGNLKIDFKENKFDDCDPITVIASLEKFSDSCDSDSCDEIKLIEREASLAFPLLFTGAAYTHYRTVVKIVSGAGRTEKSWQTVVEFLLKQYTKIR